MKFFIKKVSTLSMNFKDKRNIIVSINLLLWMIFFLWFWSSGYLFKADGSVWAKSLGTWADGAAHLTYISAMAERVPSQSPVYLGKAFTYPFVADGLSALLVRVGVNIFTAYNLVGMVLSVILVIALYRFYVLILQSQVKAVLSLNLFLLSGGLGFIKFFQDFLRDGQIVIKEIPREYTNIDEWSIRWINIVTAELIPQRAFLLAIPLGVIFLWWLWKFFRKETLSKWHTLVSGLLLGFMPVIHAHTYLTFSIICVWTVIWLCLSYLGNLSDLRKDKRVVHLTTLGVIAASISLPIMLFHIMPASDQSFIQKWPGWLAYSMKVNWLWWWFVNLGFFLPLALIGWFKAAKSLRAFSFGFWLVFIISNLIIFQPYDWDNAKLLTWVFLVFSPLVVLALEAFWKRRLIFKGLVIVLFLTLVLSGFIDVVRQLQPHINIPMYEQEKLILSEWIKSHTDPEAVFLTGFHHTHPIPTLTGRQIVMGYQGWLWSYGIDYYPREQEIKAFYLNPGNHLDLLEKYGIDYVVVGMNERGDLNAQPSMFEVLFEAIYTSESYTIFVTD